MGIKSIKKQKRQTPTMTPTISSSSFEKAEKKLKQTGAVVCNNMS